jgi:hypothetical protein
MKLPTPSAPFSPVYVHGESITIETEGKVLVLPTGNADALPSFNEYNPTQLTDGVYSFSDNDDVNIGLKNLKYTWIAVYNSTGSEIDFFYFTSRPQNLTCIMNKTISLILYPGNGIIYHGRLFYSDLTRDSNSNTVPDCFESDGVGSLTKFLQSHGFFVSPDYQYTNLVSSDGMNLVSSDGYSLVVR